MNDNEASNGASFLAGGGEMATLIAAHDWSASLGPIAIWPQSLKTSVGLLIHSPVPIVLLWGADGIMLYNDAYSAFAGARHPRLLGSKVREGWPEVAAFNDHVMTVCMAGGTLSYKDQELTLNRSGKPEPGWMNLGYSPVIDESGKPGGVIAVVVETTERVLAERRVLAQSARLEQMFRDAPSFMVQLDGPQHVVAFANASYQQLVGHRDLIGKPIRVALPEIEGQGFFELLDQLYASGESYRGHGVTVPLQRTPGAAPEERVLDFVYQPVRDASGAVTGIFVEGTDVTDAARAASALQKSEQRLQFALDAAAMGSFIWHVDDDMAEGDARMMALFGLPPDGLLTLKTALADSIDARDAPRYAEAVKRACDPSGDGTLRQDIRVRLPDGGLRWLSISGQVGFGGEPRRALQMAGAARDITTSRRTEAELRNNEARLRFLDTLGKANAQNLDADAVLATTTRLVAEYLSVSVCAYADMDADQNGFTVRGDWSAPGSSSIVGHYRLSDFGRRAVTSLSAGLPLIVNDNLRELPPQEAAAFQAIGVSATICMPLVKDGRLTALMAIHDKHPRQWTASDLAVIADVTERSWAHVERARAVAELHASESLFRTMAQAMPNQVWAATPQGQLDWFNEQTFAFSGLGYDELAGERWTGIVHPDDLPDAGVRWAQALATGEAYETEFRLRRFDSVYRWHIARAVPTKDGAGRVTRWVGTNTDIHDQKAAVMALRELNADLERRVIERTQARGRTWQVSPDLMGALNSEGYFETSNPAWQSMLGWSEAEVASMSIFELLHPDDVERTRAGFQLTQQGQPAIQFPNRYRAKDGSYRWISWVGVPEDGMVYCSGRDITAEKEKEAEFVQMQEALRQSQKMEAVGQLTGGIAHDFNNLLQGITGSLDRVQYRLSQGRSADVDRFLKAAIDSANRAAALTHRLLAFSRRQTLDPRALDANRLIGGMEDMLRRTMGPTIAMEVVGAGGLWPIRADPSQLENALLNLCINARDAMPDGGKATIETANKWLDDRAARERGLPPGQYVSLCVTDTGTGMTPDVIARAFDPFFTTKPMGQGTGLGLSMIYGFVRQSGGQVRIYSELGKGTTMCLYFPRHVGRVDEDAPALSEIVERGFGETVLVVDDEATVRMLIAEVLSESGYNIVEAGDGLAALKILETGRRIDLMITDVGLPGGMNGRQIADAARVMRKELKVLFITGYAENAAVGNGHLDPGMEILAKPFAMSVLANKVREMIEG